MVSPAMNNWECLGENLRPVAQSNRQTDSDRITHPAQVMFNQKVKE